MTKNASDAQEHQANFAEKLNDACEQLERAWTHRVPGRVAPDIESFLSDIVEPDRSAALGTLQRIDRLCRDRAAIEERGRTIVAAPLDTPSVQLAATIAQRPGCGSAAPTIDGEAATQAFQSLGFELASDGDSPSRPTSLSGYEILGVLGHGGMGVVYRARQVGLDRIVAIKMVMSGAHAAPEQLGRFYTEAQAVAQLQHPNIVQIHEVGKRDGLPYFSLEFVDGGTLAQQAGGKPQPVREAARTVETLARAMHYAHQHGVVHRDLKPANVLLTLDGVPKITDFGLAKRLESESSSQTRSGAVLGTPSYMAPEQASGSVHSIGPLTDVYALGAVLYELLTGRPPFLAATPMDTVMQVVRDEPVPPSQFQPKVPKDLETICLKCLQKDQTKRYASALDLAEDLRRFSNEEPILARPVSLTERLWRWRRRNPMVAALASLVACLILLGIVGSVGFMVRLAIAKSEAEQSAELAKQNEVAAVAAGELATKSAIQEKAAREIAERKEEEARLAQAESEKSRISAITTAHRVGTRVLGELKKRADLQKLRDELVNESMNLIEGVAGPSDSPSGLTDRALGLAYQRRGDLLMELGKTDQALNAYQSGRATFERMLHNDPGNSIAKFNVAILSDKVGDAIRQKEAVTAPALPFYKRSLELRESLWDQKEELTAPVTRKLVENILASSYVKHMEVSLLMGNPKQAHDYYLQYITLGAPTANPLFSIFAGDMHFHLGNADQARAHYEEALEASRTILEQDPLIVEPRRLMAASLGKLGDLNLQLGNNDLALTYYAQCYEAQSKLLSMDPKNADTNLVLALAHYRLGTVALASGKIEESDTYYAQSREISRTWADEDPTNAYKQVQVFLALARCGNYEEAATMAAQLHERVENDPGILFYVASGYALCVPAVAKAKGEMLSADDMALQDTYAARAIETLRQAVAHGYRDHHALEHDPDLQPIRTRPDFIELVASLKNP